MPRTYTVATIMVCGLFEVYDTFSVFSGALGPAESETEPPFGPSHPASHAVAHPEPPGMNGRAGRFGLPSKCYLAQNFAILATTVRDNSVHRSLWTGHRRPCQYALSTALLAAERTKCSPFLVAALSESGDPSSGSPPRRLTATHLQRRGLQPLPETQVDPTPLMATSA